MSDKTYKVMFWPDVNYEPGHWRPVMAIADRFRKEMAKEGRSCEIKFLCTPECKPIIENVRKYGKRNSDDGRMFSSGEIATVLEDLFPEGYSTLASEKPEEAHSRIDHCLKIAEGKGCIDKALGGFRPDLLVAGFFASMEALLIQYRYNEILRKREGWAGVPELKIMITTTYLRHPDEDPAITSLRFLAHHSQEQSSRLMQTATGSSKYSGSFYSIQDFIEPLQNVTELITCPKELDHDHFEHPGEGSNLHYVEPCILDGGDSYAPIPNLIYASAGSRVRDYLAGAQTMFRELKSMTNLVFANNRILKLAVGYILKETFEKEGFVDSDRIEIIDWADQTSCLKSAGSAVIHGGLATIKECIYFGIAPVVVPMGKDQMDNALRVLDKEVGAMVMLDNINAFTLYNEIMHAQSNVDIRKSMEKMRDRFKELETAAPSFGLIKEELGIV